MAIDHPSQLASQATSGSGIQNDDQSAGNASVSSEVSMKFQQDIRQAVVNCEKLIREEHSIMAEKHEQQKILLEDIRSNVTEINSNSKKLHHMILNQIKQIEKKIDGKVIDTSSGAAVDNTPSTDTSPVVYPPADVQARSLLRARERIRELEVELAKSQFQPTGGNGVSEEDVDELIKKATSELDETITELSNALHRSEEENQQNITKLQSMKGNIRVMCRIRPKLVGEEDEPSVDFGERLAGEFSHHWGKFKITEKSQGVAGNVRLLAREVDLERIFGPEATNSDIFAEVKDLIECSMRGDPVCIFCYGASGSGKTHTMGGAGGSPGLIDKAIEMLFQKSEFKKHQYQYKFELSIVEIYIDNIIDLTMGGPKEKISAAQAEWVELDSVEAAYATVARAVEARAVAKTTANANSSRSHLVFTLRVTRKLLKDDEHVTVGLLNLVDLAGSERVNVVTNTALGRQEGTAINKSLSDLTSMLESLGKGSPLTPVSAIGRLLKPCFVAGSKTLMFINVSPLERDYRFTKGTLERGAHAYQVKLEAIRNDKGSRPAVPTTPRVRPSRSAQGTPSQRPTPRRFVNRPSRGTSSRV